MNRRTRQIIALLLLFVFIGSFGAFAAEKKPVIGLIYSRHQGERLIHGKDDLKHYRDAVEANGGKVSALMPQYDEEYLNSQLKMLNGLIIPGGKDVDPSRYNEEPDKKIGSLDKELDALEFKVIDYCVKNNLPILGICRGHQILNVYFGGSLIQDIPTYVKSDKEVFHRRPKAKLGSCHHSLNVEKGSLFYEMFNAEKMKTNSNHHQSVKKLAPGFKVTGRADDGVVEIIEKEGDVLIMGVQFHPEKMRMEDPRFDVVFEKLIREASNTMIKKAEAK